MTKVNDMELESKNELYENLSTERKKLQEQGELPEWLTTMGWQLLKNNKYLYKTNSLKKTFKRVAATAASHLTHNADYFENRFFEILWKGHFALSTPAYNLGTPKGFPVSCTGNYVNDSVHGFYDSLLEVADLTKEHFGTSGYVGDIRPRGSSISGGGTASGVVPVIKMHVQAMRDITQGTSRRGSWGGYIDLMHGDFDELLDEIMAETDDYNIGINYYDDDLIRLSNKHPETVRRYQRHMKLRAISGKGYFYFPDRVARMQPPMYEKHGLRSLGSNLCNEITLHADSQHSFTCVLSSLNLAFYDEWKNTDTVYVATVFLDCIVSETLKLIDEKPEHKKLAFERIRKGTEKSRALGLGVMGFHTYLQEKMIAFESMEAIKVNDDIFTHIHDESLRASQYLAKEYGEPEWCKGYGVRNTHRTCLPPTMSSSQICGTVSQGIEPVMANTYQQKLAGGTVTRINPKLMDIMKSRGVLTQANIDSIGKEFKGSVQHVDWLTEKEKQVFKTAYEINQFVLIDMGGDRQPKICQSQSLNVFCHNKMTEKEISELHLYAMFNPTTKGLYYMRSEPTSKGSSGKSNVTESECVSCSA